MKFKKTNGKTGTVNISKYRINWIGKSRSKRQKAVKDFLYDYWAHHVVCEEFPCVGSKMKLDFFNLTLNVAIEFDGEQHDQYIEFFHRNRLGYADSVMRDLEKAKWCEANDIQLIRLTKQDLPLDKDKLLDKGLPLV